MLLISDGEFNEIIDKIYTRNKSALNISSRSREENKGYCMIMDSRGNFYQYNEEYNKLNVNIYDSMDLIESKYNKELHIAQKDWLHQ